MPNGNLKVAVDLQVECLGLSLQSKTAYSLLQPLEAGKPGRQAQKAESLGISHPATCSPTSSSRTTAPAAHKHLPYAMYGDRGQKMKESKSIPYL